MKKKVLVVFLNLTLLLAGCGNTVSESKTSEDGSSASVPSSLSADEMFTERDMKTDYDESASAFITLSGNTAQSDSEAVEISDSTVTITDEGTYILSGTLDDGMIIVDAEKTDKVQLVLDNAQIQSSTSAALYVKQADKVFVTLASDSTNTLTNGGEYVAIDDNNIDSVIFSKDDLTLNGSGSLTVEGIAGHGIVSKDDLVITGGTYQITSASHGISAQDSVRIADGNFTISSGKDGIHAENTEESDLGYLYIAKGTFEITSETDSLSAGSILQIEDGSFNLTAGGGSENAEPHQVEGGFAPGDRGKMPEGGPDMADGNMEIPEMPGDGEGFPEPKDKDKENMEAAGAGKESTEATTTSEEDTKGTIADKENTEANTSSEGNSETANSEESTASTKGIKVDGNIVLNAGTYQIDSADDAVHSNTNITVNGGSYQITTGDDGIHADSQVSITDGDLNISKSYEGIEGQNINISGGKIQIVASDDGLNAAGGNDESGIAGNRGMDDFSADSDCFIKISGGVMYIDASGDGIDSNGSLTVTGGETYVSGSENGGNAALDYGGEASISGGILVATGASQMAQNFGEDSKQGVMLVTVDSQESNSTIQLKDSSGNVLVEYTPAKAYDSAVVSVPELTKGENYTLVTGAAETSVTMDSLVYGESSMGGAPDGKQMDGDRKMPKEMPQETQ